MLFSKPPVDTLLISLALLGLAAAHTKDNMEAAE